MQPNDPLIRPKVHQLTEIVVFDPSRFRWRRQLSFHLPTGPFS